MSGYTAPLVPSNLARSPMQWSAQEVKAWLGFCVEEFSLSPVCMDKFDMNGKALCLLLRSDFMERAPHAGDVLFNAFQQLKAQDANSTPKKPVPAPSLPHYIPILPQPPGKPKNDAHYIHMPSLNVVPGEEPPSVYIPASMLSPAPTEKYSSDSDSCHNERGSPIQPSESNSEKSSTPKSEDGFKWSPNLSASDGDCRLLWEFIYQLLQDDTYSHLVCWDKESEQQLTFRINKPMELAELWGMQKNRSNMTYEKLSRALRYYYKMKIIRKVQGKRLTYEFLQHPSKIRKGQRGAKPHSQKLLTSTAHPSSPEMSSPESEGRDTAQTPGEATTSELMNLGTCLKRDQSISHEGDFILSRDENGKKNERGCDPESSLCRDGCIPHQPLCLNATRGSPSAGLVPVLYSEKQQNPVMPYGVLPSQFHLKMETSQPMQSGEMSPFLPPPMPSPDEFISRERLSSLESGAVTGLAAEETTWSIAGASNQNFNMVSMSPIASSHNKPLYPSLPPLPVSSSPESARSVGVREAHHPKGSGGECPERTHMSRYRPYPTRSPPSSCESAHNLPVCIPPVPPAHQSCSLPVIPHPSKYSRAVPHRSDVSLDGSRDATVINYCDKYPLNNLHSEDFYAHQQTLTLKREVSVEQDEPEDLSVKKNPQRHADGHPGPTSPDHTSPRGNYFQHSDDFHSKCNETLQQAKHSELRSRSSPEVNTPPNSFYSL